MQSFPNRFLHITFCFCENIVRNLISMEELKPQGKFFFSEKRKFFRWLQIVSNKKIFTKTHFLWVINVKMWFFSPFSSQSFWWEARIRAWCPDNSWWTEVTYTHEYLQKRIFRAFEELYRHFTRLIAISFRKDNIQPKETLYSSGNFPKSNRFLF